MVAKRSGATENAVKPLSDKPISERIFQVLRPSLRARRLVVDPHLAKADPARQTLEEAVALRQLAQRICRARRQQAEVAGILGNFCARAPIEQRIETLHGDAPRSRFVGAVRLGGIDHVAAVIEPMADQCLDQSRRMLAVAVDEQHGAEPGVIEAGEQRRFLAEIARQRHHLDVEARWPATRARWRACRRGCRRRHRLPRRRARAVAAGSARPRSAAHAGARGQRPRYRAAPRSRARRARAGPAPPCAARVPATVFGARSSGSSARSLPRPLHDRFYSAASRFVAQGASGSKEMVRPPERMVELGWRFARGVVCGADEGWISAGRAPCAVPIRAGAKAHSAARPRRLRSSASSTRLSITACFSWREPPFTVAGALALFAAVPASCRCSSADTVSFVAANMISWAVAVTGSYVLNSSITFAGEFGGKLRWRGYRRSQPPGSPAGLPTQRRSSSPCRSCCCRSRWPKPSPFWRVSSSTFRCRTSWFFACAIVRP